MKIENKGLSLQGIYSVLEVYLNHNQWQMEELKKDMIGVSYEKGL